MRHVEPLLGEQPGQRSARTARASRRASTGSRSARAAPRRAHARAGAGADSGSSCSSIPGGGRPVLVGMAQRDHGQLGPRARRVHSSFRTRRDPFSGARGASEAQRRMRTAAMLAACGACVAHQAVVISPLLPDPPVTGGQKRTLRLLETMARAGLHPRILTAERARDGAADRLRARGWTVEIVPEPDPSIVGPARQHGAGCRARA